MRYINGKRNNQFSLGFVTLLIIALLLVYGCTNEDDGKIDVDENGGGTTKEDVEESNGSKEELPEVVYAGAIHFPPMETIENGKFSGPGIEIVKEAFKRMGYEEEAFIIQDYPWKRILEMVKTGELDLVIDISYSDQRNEYLEYSEEQYAAYTKNLFALKETDVEFNGDLSELSDYKIGLVRGYKYGDAVVDAKDNKVIDYEEASTIHESLEKLINGRVPLIIEDHFAAELLFEELGHGDKVKMLEPAVDKTTTYIGFSRAKGITTLREMYDETIRVMKEDGTIDSIMNKYFEE